MKKKENIEKANCEYVPIFIQGENIYELVYNGKKSAFVELRRKMRVKEGKLIKENKYEAVYHDKLHIEGKYYIPLNDELISKKVVSIPSGILDYGTDEELITEIRAFIHKYLDVKPDYEVFAAHYILLTYIYDRLNTVPYLRCLGDFSTGKSRFLDVIGRLCYRAIVCAGNITPAALFRVQELYKGTPVIDEGDRDKSDESQAFTKIINNGFERGKPILRVDKNDPSKLQAFDAFGPKVIATRRPFQDQATESRCLTEEMRETSRTDIPVILPSIFYDQQEILKQKLLMFRLRKWNTIDVDKIQTIDLGPIESRLKQGLSNFAVLFTDNPVLLENYKKFVFEYQKGLIEDRENSLDGLIVNYLLELSKEELPEQITAGDVCEYLRENQKMEKLGPKKVGIVFKSLGIKTGRGRRDGKSIRPIIWDQELMEKLFKKYNSEYWTVCTKDCPTRHTRHTNEPQKSLIVSSGSTGSSYSGDRHLKSKEVKIPNLNSGGSKDA